MEKNRITELLNIVETTKKKLENYDSQTFVGFLANSSKTYYLSGKSREEYIRLLYFSTKQVKQVINGGKAGNEGYTRFIERELRISKVGERISVEDERFAKMNMEELAYVFGWLRRTVADTTKSSNKKQGNYNQNSYQKKYQSNNKAKTYSGEQWGGGNSAFDKIFKK